MIYPGGRGSETGWGTLQGTTSPAFPGILNWALGANYDAFTIDWDTDTATIDAMLAPTVNFMSSDLSRFRSQNGKLILYHGFADLQSFNGGNPDGEAVDLMITGKLQHNGHTAGFATSAIVRVHR